MALFIPVWSDLAGIWGKLIELGEKGRRGYIGDLLLRIGGGQLSIISARASRAHILRKKLGDNHSAKVI